MRSFESSREFYRQRVESALAQRLPPADNEPAKLHQAMRYSCLDGGKRFRAMLVYATGELLGASVDLLDVPACAVELIHAYSLVHDDLPCMDDDATRRGRPTCHCAFDEATALLVGDAAQTLAFNLIAADPALAISDASRLRMVTTLTEAAGTRGMAGGQSLDMEATNNHITVEQLKLLHRMKTGALIRASCLLGGMAAVNVNQSDLDALARYGDAIGLAFQVMDDILDVTSDSETLGKSSGADEKMHKSTYVSMLGLEQARQICSELHAQAVESAGVLGDNRGLLSQLADFVVRRTH